MKHGLHENNVRIDKMSNHRFTQTELEKWRTNMRDSRQPTFLNAGECQRRHERLLEISSNHVYTTEEIAVMVERRNKSAIASGKQNLAQVRLKLQNDVDVEAQTVASLRQRVARLKAAAPAGGQPPPPQGATEARTAQLAAEMERLVAAESRLAGLVADMERVVEHQRERVASYAAQDRLGSVNDRNRGRNHLVDGEDSRATLAAEFMGTGDEGNKAFQRTRTKMVDLWATKKQSKEAEVWDAFKHASTFNKIFKAAAASGKLDKAAAAQSKFTKSK